jgi:class 3 adenylate cyclase/pimeloyl-ACP methyl ester carboxylesterase
MEREVRYCTTEDGVRIAYCVEGDESAPALLILPLFVESFALDHMLPAYREFISALGQGRRVIRMDYRGTGLSERGVANVTYKDFIYDLRAVLAAARIERTAIWATTTSGITALQFALWHPDAVSRLVLYGTFASLPAVFPEPTLRSFVHLAESNWELASHMFADMTGRREFPDEGLRFGEWYEQSCVGTDAAARMLANIGYDLTDSLPKIATPSLVIHRINDPTFPIDQGRALAAHLPSARFLQLPGSTHAAYLGDSEPILEAVEAFLDEDPETRSTLAIPQAQSVVDSTFRTVLFTDIVGHTEMMRRLGDDKGRAVLREHEDITRSVLKQHGGTEVKTMGDGFMASFGSVTKAVECAVALQRAFAEREGEPLNVRVGLNAGEPIEEDGDLFGATVILASRIAAKADGGEILVADTVRGLCSGKGFLFADRGEFVAKGFEEPVRVYEVNWRAK